ncbi:hypothetical protein MIND_00623000 [Mycena indigotica]|uniref:Uncharacterized protein n=1 Tax=Mycena indigotica TaxID=2126181 RepID=A0A8H6SU20_9AGAR|nr:uncharacterized protein MIND_00623000 [Mycena indigotica]KAF7303925.1 hypothetical protein MIND_00623000 [Mycena indigotica]
MYLGRPAPSSSAASFCAFAKNTIHSSIDTAADTARLVFSFESLLVVSLLAFLVLGVAFFMLLWSLVTEEEEDNHYYRHAESGVYHQYTGDDRWVSVPVILMPRSTPSRRKHDEKHHRH